MENQEHQYQLCHRHDSPYRNHRLPMLGSEGDHLSRQAGYELNVL